jgi:DNA-binding Lrp family transcriptional regulator
MINVVNEINIPKETARRKIIELEKQGVILRHKKKVIINRSAFIFIEPIKSIKRISRFLSLLSDILVKKKILLKPLTSNQLEKIIKFNFSYIWKIYYELQLTMMLSYKKVFRDLESFAIYGTCIVNQHYLKSKKKNKNKKKRYEFILTSYSDKNLQGLNAMSISDITGIPRATVVRKLKKLLKLQILTINNKKHYKLTGNLLKTLMPLQDTVLRRLADFSTRVYNLTTL